MHDLLLAIHPGDVELERSAFAALGLHFVKAHTSHIGHTAIEMYMRRDRLVCGQRSKILLDQGTAGGIALRSGRLPAGLLEESRRGGIDTILPGREQLHMAPSQRAVANARPSLEQNKWHVALDQASGSCQTHRPG